MALEAKKTLIFRIYQILEQYSDEEHPLMQQDIVNRLERDYGIVCERKAVGRNLSFLKEMGFDIESSKKGSYLATRQLENAELRLLIDSVLSSRHISPTHSAQLIDKLIALGGRNFKSHVKHVYSVKEWEKTENQDFFFNIEIVEEAIDKGKKITFDYNKIGLDKKLHKSLEHKGSPYQMLLHNQRYYLMMYDEVFSSIGYYRLGKITNIKIIQENAKPLRENHGFEHGIDYSAFVTSLPYMYNDTPVDVVIKCRNFMTDNLADWFGTDFKIKPVDNENFEATIRVSEKAMLFWVLQYNYRVEVIAPKSLRDKVCDTLKKTLNKYMTQDEV